MNDRQAEADSLRRLIVGYRLSQAIFVAARLRIADLLADGAKSVEELSRATGANSNALFRVLRLLASEGVFACIGDHTFTLTPLASRLQANGSGSLRERALFDGEELNWNSWGNLYQIVLGGGSAVAHTYGMELFDYLEHDTTSNARFNALMAEQTSAAAQAVVESYDFGHPRTVVDVGGGYGALLECILGRYPKTRGVVVELPHVVSGARARLAAAGMGDRVTVVAGDFFESVPPGGDIYLLKYILHDWSDAESRVILKNCRRVTPVDGRLLVIEVIIPPGNGAHYGKYLDLNMLVLTKGQERTEKEYRGLLESCGFLLSRVIETPSELRLIECRPLDSWKE